MIDYTLKNKTILDVRPNGQVCNCHGCGGKYKKLEWSNGGPLCPVCVGLQINRHALRNGQRQDPNLITELLKLSEVKDEV